MPKQINILTLMMFCWGISASAQEARVGKTVIDPIGYLKEKPSESSQTIVIIPAGDTIELCDWYEQPYVKVNYDGISAYISIACLKFNADLMSILQKDSSGRSQNTLGTNNRRNTESDCHATANCGCSNKKKADCVSKCCQWIVGKGCSCR